jgi:hypothetical protein
VAAVQTPGRSFANSRNRGDLSRAQRRWLIAPNALVLGLETRLLGQGLLPLPLEGASNQPVLRLDGIELSAHALGFVAGPLDPLLPLTLNRLSFLFQIGRHQQACLQCRRLKRREHQPFHQCVKRRRLQRLTDRLSVIRCHTAAGTAPIGAVVIILCRHAQSAAAADQQPG